MNRSFQLIRTNPRLTTNIKIVVDSEYNLYFESFNSSRELSNEQYKHYLLNREALLENEIPKFYGKLPINIAFAPRTLRDEDIMYNEYRQQFDNMYYSGADEIEDQWHNEEFEYFAPLYFRKNNLPKNFVILRVDDAGIYKRKNDDYILDELDRNNFKEEIIDKWKCVKLFDLTDNTNLGKFLDRNINDNNRFPDFSMFFDTKPYNYSKWSGIDYDTGVYNTAELFLDDKLFYSNGHFNLEEFITSSFEKNNLIYPYILNMKFLFNDKRGTPNEMLPWTMNRYYGFYIEDMEIVKTITSFRLPELKDGLTISNNVFLLNNQFVNPFVLNLTSNQWIQVENDFYEVRRQENGSFKIISDRNLTGLDPSTFGKGNNWISSNYISNIDDFDIYVDENGDTKDMFADLYLIDIDGMYHVLKKDSNGFFIHSDYAVSSNNSVLQYWKGGVNSEYSVLKDTINEDGSPLSFKIYRVKFLDIKDFDFDRINTKYSDFDYEKSEYYETPEVKLYANEYRDNSIPIRKKLHDKGEDGQYKPMIISSEYSSCDETFEIRSNRITPIFEKNQSICKWVYDGSISHSDYPYKLNNNFNCGGVYNRTVNTEMITSNVKEKTLDYFYRIGDFYSKEIVPFFEEDLQGNIEDKWIVSGNTEYPNDNSGIIITINNLGETYTIELIKNIEIGQYYNISFKIATIGGGLSNVTYGPDESVFLNLVSTNNLPNLMFSPTYVEESFIGISNSTNFIFNVRMNTGLIGDVVILKDFKIIKLSNKYYLNQSTNIQLGALKNFDTVNILNRFNLQLYIESNFDYFDFFFKNNMIYEDKGKLFEKSYLKYSIFGGGDNELPSTTLFKGLEFNIYDVEDIVLEQRVGIEQKIRNVITNGGNKFNGYKFSVILSENYNYYKFDKDINGNYINGEFLSNVNESLFGSNELLDSQRNNINIFLNEKYKNILVIINKNIPMNIEWGTLNYFDEFGENFGLYNGTTKDGINLLPVPVTGVDEYNPNDLTAFNFIKSANELNIRTVYDTYVNYYMIDENGNFAKTEMIRFNDIEGNDRFRDLPNWDKKYPPFLLQVTTSSDISLKPNSYKITPLRGPVTNIYDKYLVYSDRKPLKESYIDQPLARSIIKNEVDETKVRIFHGEKIKNTNKIFRYVGYYEPVFKDLNIFEPTYYWSDGQVLGSITGNYSFNLSSEQFGIVDEIMYSKVNELDNYLKLKDSDNDRSFFPMVDEIGISQTKRFIFLSPWDRTFYIRTLNEQTFLENYVQTPISLTPQFETLAEIISSQIIGGFDNSFQINFSISNLGGEIPAPSSGPNVYGWGRSPIPFEYRLTIKNLSSIAKNIGIRLNYVRSTGSTPPVFSGSSGLIQPNETKAVDFSAQRPLEIKTGQSTYQDFTVTELRYELYDLDINTSLDIKTFQGVRVYNDLRQPNLLTPTYELGKIGNHIIGGSYWFQIILDDIEKKVPYSYTTQLYIKNYDDDFVLFRTLSTAKPSIPSSTILRFNNVLLDNSKLNIPPLTEFFTDVKFVVTTSYTIETITQSETSIFEDSGYKIISS